MRPENVELRPDDGTSATHIVEHFEFQGADSMVTVASANGIRLHARVSGTQSLALGDRVAPVYTGPPAAAFDRG